MKAYENTGIKPVIEATKNAFKITLPNINAKYDSSLSVKEPPIAYKQGLYDEEHKVLELAERLGEITRYDVENLLEVSASTATRILRKMVMNKTLKQYGKARNTRYRKC